MLFPLPRRSLYWLAADCQVDDRTWESGGWLEQDPGDEASVERPPHASELGFERGQPAVQQDRQVGGSRGLELPELLQHDLLQLGAQTGSFKRGFAQRV